MPYDDWTKQELHDRLTDPENIKLGHVNLDISESSPAGVDSMIQWGLELGWTGTRNSHGETATFVKNPRYRKPRKT